MKEVHGEKSGSKQRAKRVVAKRGTELLCEVEALEPVIEWIEQDDVINANDFMGLLEENQEGFDGRLPVISDMRQWLQSPFGFD